MPLPPEMSRRNGLRFLMDDSYNKASKEIKDHIKRINEIYREIVQTWELPSESQTPELINIMLSRTRSMLNFILDNIL